MSLFTFCQYGPADLLPIKGTCTDLKSQWSEIIAETFDSLIVVAAGNGTDGAHGMAVSGYLNNSPLFPYVFLPASFGESEDNVITVAAVDLAGNRAELSNYGAAVTIAAPGRSMFSLIPGDDYGWNNGTSFAAPLVTGVAGLMLAVNRDLKAPELKQLLEQGARQGNRSVTTPDGHVLYTLNAYESVLLAQEVGESTGTPIETIQFPDLNLRKCVLDTAAAQGWQSAEQFSSLNCQGGGISSIEGLEYFARLNSLFLGESPEGEMNRIENIQPLASLTSLTALDLSYNSQITDISPLAELSQLVTLNLVGNQIADITPLAGLAHLKELYLNFNRISDVGPIAHLSTLTRLGLQQNQVADISPLKGLSQLTELDLFDNHLTSISSLSELSGLASLSVGKNPITSIAALFDLHQLEYLNLLQIIGIPCTDLDALSAALPSSTNIQRPTSCVATFAYYTGDPEGNNIAIPFSHYDTVVREFYGTEDSLFVDTAYWYIQGWQGGRATCWTEIHLKTGTTRSDVDWSSIVAKSDKQYISNPTYAWYAFPLGSGFTFALPEHYVAALRCEDATGNLNVKSTYQVTTLPAGWTYPCYYSYSTGYPMALAFTNSAKQGN